MRVNVNHPMVDLEGNPIPEKQDGTGTFMLKKVLIDALLQPFKDEENLSGEEKLKRFEMALKIKGVNDIIDFSSEDITLMKKLIGKMYTTLIVGQAWKILEGE